MGEGNDSGKGRSTGSSKGSRSRKSPFKRKPREMLSEEVDTDMIDRDLNDRQRLINSHNKKIFHRSGHSIAESKAIPLERYISAEGRSMYNSNNSSDLVRNLDKTSEGILNSSNNINNNSKSSSNSGSDYKSRVSSDALNLLNERGQADSSFVSLGLSKSIRAHWLVKTSQRNMSYLGKHGSNEWYYKYMPINTRIVRKLILLKF